MCVLLLLLCPAFEDGGRLNTNYRGTLEALQAMRSSKAGLHVTKSQSAGLDLFRSQKGQSLCGTHVTQSPSGVFVCMCSVCLSAEHPHRPQWL